MKQISLIDLKIGDFFLYRNDLGTYNVAMLIDKEQDYIIKLMYYNRNITINKYKKVSYDIDEKFITDEYKLEQKHFIRNEKLKKINF